MFKKLNQKTEFTKATTHNVLVIYTQSEHRYANILGVSEMGQRKSCKPQAQSLVHLLDLR